MNPIVQIGILAISELIPAGHRVPIIGVFGPESVALRIPRGDPESVEWVEGLTGEGANL